MMAEEHKNKIKFLITFLKEKNVYCKFKNNLLLQKRYAYYDKYIRKNINREAIFNAFTWVNSKEGHLYWCKLDTEFREKYMKKYGNDN